MSMLNHIQNKIFFFKNIVLRKNAFSQYKIATDNAKLSRHELENLNFHKRKKIIEFAYNSIPFYQEFYDRNNFHPDHLISQSDWIKVPILEKDMVRENIDKLKDPNLAGKYFGVSTTGGSTGLPLKVYADLRFNQEVLGWRTFDWWNVSPASNVGIIHRRTPTTFLGKLKNRALWWPTKRIYLNAASVSDKDLRKFTSEISQKKIVWLQGYVGGLERVADYIIGNNIKISTLKLIWSTSAPLSGIVRQKLETAFHCKVMNQYGSNEVYNIAIQCPYTNDLHVNYDYVHVDVINEKGDNLFNQEGELLVTNLESFAFPLIKYRIGDKAEILTKSCQCGNELPLIKEIKGRVSDAIYTPTNLYIDGAYLTSIFDDYTDFVSQYQIYQKDTFEIIIYVKVYQLNIETENVLMKVRDIMLTKVNFEIPVRIEVVEHINDDNGKIRYIISEIARQKAKLASVSLT